MIILRKATLADAKVLRRWRNDAATMAAAGQHAPMSFEEHVQWLAAYPIWVGEMAGISISPIGESSRSAQDDRLAA